MIEDSEFSDTFLMSFLGTLQVGAPRREIDPVHLAGVEADLAGQLVGRVIHMWGRRDLDQDSPRYLAEGEGFRVHSERSTKLR